jgi:transposase
MPQRHIFIKLERPELYALNNFLTDMSVKGNRCARLRGQVIWFSHQNHIPERIAHELNYPLNSVYKWLSTYRKNGLKGLYDKSRKRKLTAEQINEIMTISNWAGSLENDKKHQQRWTFRKIARWIKDKWDIDISHERVRKIVNEKMRE